MQHNNHTRAHLVTCDCPQPHMAPRSQDDRSHTLALHIHTVTQIFLYRTIYTYILGCPTA